MLENPTWKTLLTCSGRRHRARHLAVEFPSPNDQSASGPGTRERFGCSQTTPRSQQEHPSVCVRFVTNEIDIQDGFCKASRGLSFMLCLRGIEKSLGLSCSLLQYHVKSIMRAVEAALPGVLHQLAVLRRIELWVLQSSRRLLLMKDH